MYKLYFKQAIAMLKQNKFISLIAILGTALAIMMIMSIIVSDEIRNISAAPEVNRDRTYYVAGQVERDTVRGFWNSGWVHYIRYQMYLSDLETPERVCLTREEDCIVKRPGTKTSLIESVKQTDEHFWHIYSLNFLEGGPFTAADAQSGVKHAVIRKSVAQKLFQSESALGQMVDIDFALYRIVGVVEDFSPVFKMADAGLWIPYTSKEGYNQNNYRILLLLGKDTPLSAMDQEIREREKRYDAETPNRILRFRGPESHKVNSLDLRAMQNEDIAALLKTKRLKSAVIFLILLLVPAINLSGLSLSRMKRRTAEIGVRKAFGAKRHTILIQVLYENFITSLIGGVLGLLLSYGVVYLMKEWLLGVSGDSMIPVSALVSWPVFVGVFVLCVLLNLLSAGIPAYRTSRLMIVNSLNENEK